MVFILLQQEIVIPNLVGNLKAIEFRIPAYPGMTI